MLRLHDGGRVLGSVEISDIIYFGYKRECRRIHIIQAACFQNACIGYKNVDAAKMLYRIADHLLHGSRVGYIHLQTHGAVSECLGRFLRLIHVQVCKYDTCSLIIHLCGNSKTKALGSSGYHCDFTSQTACGRRTVVNVFLGIFLCFCQIHDKFLL